MVIFDDACGERLRLFLLMRAERAEGHAAHHQSPAGVRMVQTNLN
jgi:hypothetical protein